MKYKKSYLLLSFLLLWCLTQLSAQGFVHAEGTRIVDQAGQDVLKRGMGLGGWLVPEGYMLQWPGPGSPTQIRTQILDLIGEEATERFYAKYESNYVTRDDIKMLAEWGFDHIRLPFHYNQFSPEPGIWIDKGFTIIDSMIAWCRSADMLLVLDMHAAPGAQNGGPISDSDGTAHLWFETVHQDHTVEIWQKIAERYVDETLIAGYDLLNEPVHWGVSSAAFRALYVRIVNAIRQVDTNHIVFVEGNWYGTDFTGLTPPFDSNMVYSFHKYWSINSLASINSYLQIRDTYQVPLWMGESGENSNHWFYEATKLFEENNVGWCWWTHKKFEHIATPLSAHLPDGFELIQQYLSAELNVPGSGIKPNPAFSETILMRFADALETDACIERPGVIPSLFDPEYGLISKPLKYQRFPGLMLAADYDVGANGVAYSDKVVDTRHCCGDPYTAWNTGHQYRNDGVDIKLPANTGIPSVHWIERGEWLQYTTIFAHDGIFDFHFQVSSEEGGGEIELFIDDTSQGTVSVPSTGSGSSWQYITMSGKKVLAGKRTLTLDFNRGGLNLQRIKVTVDEIRTNNLYPNRFQLGKNYPNPFNSGTVIPIDIERADDLVLEIYDLQGHLIKTFDLSQRVKGPAEIIWNGDDWEGTRSPAGVYIYLLNNGKQNQSGKMTLLH